MPKPHGFQFSPSGSHSPTWPVLHPPTLLGSFLTADNVTLLECGVDHATPFPRVLRRLPPAPGRAPAPHLPDPHPQAPGSWLSPSFPPAPCGGSGLSAQLSSARSQAAAVSSHAAEEGEGALPAVPRPGTVPGMEAHRRPAWQPSAAGPSALHAQARPEQPPNTRSCSWGQSAPVKGTGQEPAGLGLNSDSTTHKPHGGSDKETGRAHQQRPGRWRPYVRARKCQAHASCYHPQLSKLLLPSSLASRGRNSAVFLTSFLLH